VLVAGRGTGGRGSGEGERPGRVGAPWYYVRGREAPGMRIEGDTAFVTGGGRGIGAEISRELADRGLAVVAADVDTEAAEATADGIRESGGTAHAVTVDLRDAESVRGAAEAAREAVGTVDVLVNNAGIAGPTAAVEDVAVEEWDRTLAVNLRGAFLTSRALVGPMKEQGYGRIVNVSSISGKRAVPRRAPYTASKSGLLGLTRTLAAEGGPHDVNANAICPGSVEGPRIRRVIEDEATESGRSVEAVADEKRDRSLRGEFVRGADVAELTAYLCSAGADRITGQSLTVSAGQITH